ncbi:hypothetical protein VTN77DRAFT_986 [Rasamsonia byssochlamydoides]|uniref:uncharacterized protein n=1 Tax=Rasamsonia byssochlamydoides TaxID=89139 RepID=UPI0037441753
MATGDMMELELDSTQLRDRVKAGWRACQNLDQFAELGQLSVIATTDLRNLMTAESHIDSFTTWILNQAKEYMSLVQIVLRARDLTGVQQFPAEDDIVSVFPALLAISPRCKDAKMDDYHRLLLRLLPSRSSQSPSSSAQREARIAAYYKYYSSGIHLAPFTSIIGPSGIGKSFLVKELAFKNYSYVVYACLATDKASSYPQRSQLANVIVNIIDRPELTTFWECFIAASLVHVAICKDLGITAAGFYDLQVLETFVQFQITIARRVQEFFYKVYQSSTSQGTGNRRERSDKDDQFFDYQKDVNQFVDEYKTDMTPVFQKAKSDIFTIQFSRTVAEGNYICETSINLGTEHKDQPLAIICFDEIRELFKVTYEEPPVKYLALRRAMRHQTKVREGVDNKRFFGLLLDTSSRISELSPSREMDPSLKYLRPGHLFPPIYRLDTFDIFVGATGTQYHPNKLTQTETPALRSLFSFGRPLWGALLEKATLSMVLEMAQARMYGRHMYPKNFDDPLSNNESLALISYRLNFYVAHFGLAEALTSGHLRALCDDASKGFIKVGDVGEVVAALTLMFSFDKAHGEGYPRPVKLHNFIKELFPEAILGQVQSRMQNHADMTRLWDRGFVFFNHVVRVSKKPTVRMLAGAYSRCAVIFPSQNFGDCDIIVPVFVQGDHREGDRMSYILVQVKNWQDDTLSTRRKNDAKDSFKTAEGLLPHVDSYIGVFMSLRGNPKNSGVEVVYPLRKNTETAMTRQAAATTPSMLGNETYNWNEGAHIVIFSLGDES